MQIVLTGPFPLSFNSEVPFFDYAFDGELDIVSQSSTAIQLRNLDTGARITVNGTGLSVNPTSGAMTGTASGWVVRDPNGTVVTTVTGIAWGLAEMVGALDALMDFENEAPILALFSRQAITIDASAATGATRVQLPDGITSAITLIGSDFRDDLKGSNGNDRIVVDGAPSNEGTNIYASRGNDTIDLSGVAANAGWVELIYHQGPATSIFYTYNGNTNTGQVQKVGVGVDTLIDPKKAVNSNGGIDVFGTDGSDIFTITTAATDIWGGIIYGGRGVDSYNLNLSESGGVRLNFRGNWFEWDSAPQALNLDLTRSAGQIQNDGYGNVETITRSGLGRLEIHGTRHADLMIGSALRESFISGGGNDTIHGGAGFDRIRFDRGEMTSGVNVDLAAGTATGRWQGQAFTIRMTGIEEVRGTRTYNDTIRGDDGNNLIDLRDGDDLIYDRGGNDTVYGGGGNDTFMAGGGEDRFYGGDGVDLLVLDVSGFAAGAFIVETDLTAGRNGGRGITAGRDVLDSIEQVQVIGALNAWLNGSAVDNLLTGGDGNDTIYGLVGDDTLIGNGGNDFLIGGLGNDSLSGGAGNDTIWAGAGDDVVEVESGNNEVWAGTGNDLLFGGTGNDILGGGAGDDEIDGRAGGRNQLWGGDGQDTIHASDNGDTAGGGWGNDVVWGGAGGDTLMGGLGNDTLSALDGNDVLYFGMGSDEGYGGAGNDTLFAGPGFDRLWGGAGADRFEFWRDYGWNRVEDFTASEGDVIGLGRGMWTGTAGVLTAAQVVQRFGSITAVGDAVLNFAAAGTTVVIVGAGTLDGLSDHILIL